MDTVEPTPRRQVVVRESRWGLLRQFIEVAAAVVVLVEILVAPAVVIAIWRWLL